MFRLQFVSSLALSCLAALVAQPARAEPRAVIELFTSQGCSSCPAADKLIAEYSRDPSIIALSLAVDYWDYLGWKDTLALPVSLTVADSKVTVNVPAGADQNSIGEVWLCSVIKSVPVVIGRGENHGRTVTYSNVVRRWIKLGDWTGKAETFSVPVKDVQTDNVDSAAVMVQTGVASAPKLMLGAAQIAVQ